MSSIISRSLSSVRAEFIFSITDDNDVPVTADSLTRKLWRVNVGDVTALLHKPQHGVLAVPCWVPAGRGGRR